LEEYSVFFVLIEYILWTEGLNKCGHEGYTHTLALLGRAEIKTGEVLKGVKHTFKALFYNPIEIQAWRNLFG